MAGKIRGRIAARRTVAKISVHIRACIFRMAAKFRRLNYLAEHVMKARRMLKAKCRVKEGRRLSGRRRSCTF